ncbi:MAG TPA: hypothetical protein VJV03_09610 [Pyrinomonadaceae bacterium]|nr:hypothetical protein [Pyrinomonadaceae bacterium]
MSLNLDRAPQLKAIVRQLLLVINMKKILTVCCLLMLGNVGIASSQTFKPRGYDPLLTKLASVKWLSNHDPGFGGNEFYKLSKEFLLSHNPSDFKRMVHSRNPIVKAMGLLCLAQVDSDKYWFTLLAHGSDKEEVYLHRGCVVSKLTIGEFTQRLLSNPYFLEAEEQRPAM